MRAVLEDVGRHLFRADTTEAPLEMAWAFLLRTAPLRRGFFSEACTGGCAYLLTNYIAVSPISMIGTRPLEKETQLLVTVRDNNVDQALKVLKKRMQREGIFREMKLRSYYEKPSERRTRERAEAVRRYRKLQRKRLQRENALSSPGRK
jgi:small subunit ribosomal protein S21